MSDKEDAPLISLSSLVRDAVHRSRGDWPVVLAVWLLLLCSTTLLAAGALYADTVATGGLRRAILDVPPSDRSIVVRAASSVDDPGLVDAAIRAELGRLPGVGSERVVHVERSGSMGVDSTAGDADDRPDLLTTLARYEGIEEHATLLAGAWPAAGTIPPEVSLSDGAADALGVSVGDRLLLASRLEPGTMRAVEIVGIWRPEPSDPYWLGDPLELAGVDARGSFTAVGPLVIGAAEPWAGLGGQVEHQWRIVPDVDALEADDVAAMRAAIEGVDERLAASLPDGPVVSVVSGLPPVLAEVDQAISVSRSGVMLVIAQFAVLAGYAVLLVAGMVVERRRPEAALMRARGATRAQVAQLSLVEALMLAVPAVILAPILAIVVVGLLGAYGPLAGSGVSSSVVPGPTPIVVALLAGLFCVVALTLPAAVTIATPAGVRAALGRQVGTTLAGRLGLDLALLLVAAVALWQLRLHGSALSSGLRGTLGVDPLLVVTPAIGLLAGAVLAVRIVPRIAEIAERLLDRGSGLVGALGGRELARRPLRYTRAALLLVLAVALGLFAGSYAATWTQSQLDQARYQAVADVRVIAPERSSLPALELGARYAGRPGVTALTPVVLQTVDVGRAVSAGTLLGVDPAAAASIVRFPDDASGRALPALLAGLEDERSVPAGPALEGEPDRITADVDVALTAYALGTDEVLTDVSPLIGLSAIVEDADGRLHRVDGLREPLSDVSSPRRETRSVALVTEPADPDGRPRYPLRLRALDVVVVPPEDVLLTGSIELAGARADRVGGQAGATAAPPASELDLAGTGWRWTRIDGGTAGGTREYRAPVGRPGLIVIGDEEGTNPPIAARLSGPSSTFRLGVAPDETALLSGIVSRRFADQTAVAEGDTIGISVQGTRLTMRVAGIVEAFPPLDPDVPFAVVDLAGLERLRFDATGLTQAAAEWWLAVEPGTAPAVTADLERRPELAAAVIEREALSASLASSPLPLGVIGALAIGALAALAFAAIGLIVSAAVSANERLGEFALLRALGLSGRELSAWLSLENAFILLVGLLAGTVLGLLLAWLVLPMVLLTEGGEPVVPAVSVVVPWQTAVPIYLLSGALLLLIVAVVRRELLRIRVGDVLRARDG